MAFFPPSKLCENFKNQYTLALMRTLKSKFVINNATRAKTRLSIGKLIKIEKKANPSKEVKKDG